MSFGELVRQHRERNGMSQQTLAECVGIDPRSLRAIENGEVASPRVVIVARMVEVLHLNPFEATALLKAVREDADSDEELSQEEAI